MIISTDSAGRKKKIQKEKNVSEFSRSGRLSLTNTRYFKAAPAGICFPISFSQWPIGCGVGLRIKRSSVPNPAVAAAVSPWTRLFTPLSQGEAFTLASISYLAILVKYILAKKKKKANLAETSWKAKCRLEY